MSKPDFCDWWTPERMKEADEVWQKQKHYLELADTVREVMRRYNLENVLELGCGAGYVGNELHREFCYIGTDGSEDMVEFAKRKFPDPTYFKCNIRDMPKFLTRHDLVCSFGVLKHFSLDEWKDIVAKMLATAEYGLIELIATSGPSINTGIENGEEYNHVYVNENEIPDVWKAAGHQILDYMCPYTVGPQEVRYFVLSKRI